MQKKVKFMLVLMAMLGAVSFPVLAAMSEVKGPDDLKKRVVSAVLLAAQQDFELACAGENIFGKEVVDLGDHNDHVVWEFQPDTGTWQEKSISHVDAKTWGLVKQAIVTREAGISAPCPTPFFVYEEIIGKLLMGTMQLTEDYKLALSNGKHYFYDGSTDFTHFKSEAEGETKKAPQTIERIASAVATAGYEYETNRESAALAYAVEKIFLQKSDAVGKDTTISYRTLSILQTLVESSKKEPDQPTQKEIAYQEAVLRGLIDGTIFLTDIREIAHRFPHKFFFDEPTYYSSSQTDDIWLGSW